MQNLILIVPLIAVMFMLFRSQKKRQQQVQSVQSTLEPGKGVRTIGGMYALVKAVNPETVELEIAPGVVAHYVKSAVAAVLDPQEYDTIINGAPEEELLSEPAEADLVEPVEPVEPADAEPLKIDADQTDSSGARREEPAEK